MPKWKKDAKEFTVSVSYHEVRGYAATIPKPIVEHLGRPGHITYVKRGAKVEVRAAES